MNVLLVSFFSIIKMSALPGGQCTEPFGCDEFPCHPWLGWGQWENWSSSRIKGKSRKQNYLPPLPGPSWVTATLQSTHKWSALQVHHIWTCPPYLEGEIPEELTPSAQTPHSKQWSRCWSVCRSVKIQARWLVPHCWMPSSLQGPTGYISPQESLPVTNDVITSNDILPGMSPSQNKLKILNQV